MYTSQNAQLGIVKVKGSCWSSFENFCHSRKTTTLARRRPSNRMLTAWYQGLLQPTKAERLRLRVSATAVISTGDESICCCGRPRLRSWSRQNAVPSSEKSRPGGGDTFFIFANRRKLAELTKDRAESPASDVVSGVMNAPACSFYELRTPIMPPPRGVLASKPGE